MDLLRIVSRLHVSRRKIATFALSAFITGIVLGALLLNFGANPSFNVLPQFTLVLSDKSMGRGVFSAALPEITIQVNAPQYHLPVDLSRVKGYNGLRNWFQITKEQEQLLSQNGFVVLRTDGFEALGDFYEFALNTGMPILITTDAVLHAYHVLFDEILKRIEMNELIDEINSTLHALLTEAQSEAEQFAATSLATACNLNLMYLEVANALMQPSFTPSTAKALQELQLISEHSCITESPIFRYEEDYTQYVPRGHYTENEQLKSYFKTMMWLGRMRFALLTERVVNVEQTRAGILLTWKVTKNTGIHEVWQRIYEITKFFVGASDDLTFEDYLAVLDENGITSPQQIQDFTTVVKVAQKLLLRNRAKILGTYAETYPWLPQEDELQRILDETAGLRFMGQRFIPDSYMFQQLVFTQVGNWTLPRLLPKGLDVPAVLGSDLAKQILDETEAVYENYTQQVEKLRAEFKTLSVTNWTRNLDWSWLYTANTTLTEIPSEANYPTFMTKSAWDYEKLQTFTGSWTELRHDTILYAKQSYTPFITSPPLPITPPTIPPAYVEPYPQTYRGLTGLLNMTINGLRQFNLLSEDIEESITSFREILGLFLTASIMELEGEDLPQDIQKEIRRAAGKMASVLDVASEKTQKATIIADVHTDTNTKQVLEEALGNFNALIIIYAGEDGNLHATAGPVYNYFEFTQPMSQRLTDETWREMLKTNPPEPPEWTENFAR